MNIYQCQKEAQKSNGNKLKFLAIFPNGVKRCKWLDEFMGCITIEGLEGFIMLSDLDDIDPKLKCEIIED